jgi:hypothetical protein
LDGEDIAELTALDAAVEVVALDAVETALGPLVEGNDVSSILLSSTGSSPALGLDLATGLLSEQFFGGESPNVPTCRHRTDVVI